METRARGEALDANATVLRAVKAASDKAKREFVSTSRGMETTCACLAKVCS